MQERTVIITGANSGIGREATLKFARAGYTVCMACRNRARSAAVQREIVSATGNERVMLDEVDMSSLESITAFCENFRERFSSLDILVHNAAYFEHGAPFRLSPDGIEITFATNVVGPFLMTQLLRDLLRESDDARVLHASSNIIKHFFSPKKTIDTARLTGKTGADGCNVYHRYRDSKMAFLMLTFRMADELKEVGIKLYSLQINGAKMSRETLAKFTFRWKLIAAIQNFFFRPADFMAENYFRICTSGDFRDMTGVHFNHKLEVMRPGPVNPSFRDIAGATVYPVYADDARIQEELRTICMDLTTACIDRP